MLSAHGLKAKRKARKFCVNNNNNNGNIGAKLFSCSHHHSQCQMPNENIFFYSPPIVIIMWSVCVYVCVYVCGPNIFIVSFIIHAGDSKDIHMIYDCLRIHVLLLERSAICECAKFKMCPEKKGRQFTRKKTIF
jgi:hypothetical protein